MNQDFDETLAEQARKRLLAEADDKEITAEAARRKHLILSSYPNADGVLMVSRNYAALPVDGANPGLSVQRYTFRDGDLLNDNGVPVDSCVDAASEFRLDSASIVEALEDIDAGRRRSGIPTGV